MLSRISNLSGPTSTSFKYNGVSSSVADQIREQLTISQKTTYDSTAVGDWIKVTSTEYNNIVSNVSGTTKYRDSDANFAVGGTQWGSPFFLVGGSASAYVPVNNYIIAYKVMCARTSQAYSIRLYSSNIFSATGSSWTGLGATVSFTTGAVANEVAYYVRKSPTTTLSVNSFIGIYSTSNLSQGTNTKPTYLFTSPGVTNYTIYNTTNPPALQILATTTKSW